MATEDTNSKRTVEIIEEDGESSIIIEDEFDRTDFNFYPESKKIEVSRSIKDDCFYSNQTFEYRISIDPVKLEMRTVESSNEPPLEYSIKDGVVLESEIIKRFGKMASNRISKAKEEVEWRKIDILSSYQVNLYILSKHPEIISNEEYRRFLRQSMERLKLGTVKIEEVIKGDVCGLQVIEGTDGRQIWYFESESEIQEMHEYYELSDDEKKNSSYEKKLEHAHRLTESLFTPSSPKYVGIEEYEFRQGKEIEDYIDGLLNKKKSIYRGEADKIKEEKSAMASDGGLKWFAVIVLSLIALSWGVWTAVGVFILGNILISLLINKK